VRRRGVRSVLVIKAAPRFGGALSSGLAVDRKRKPDRPAHAGRLRANRFNRRLGHRGAR